MIVSCYVTHHVTGTLHLVRVDGIEHPVPRTRCGLVVGERWQWGDESPNGLAATCQRCRRHHQTAVLYAVAPEAMALAAELDALDYDFDAGLSSALDKLGRGAEQELRDTTLTLDEVRALLRQLRGPVDI